MTEGTDVPARTVGRDEGVSESPGSSEAVDAEASDVASDARESARSDSTEPVDDSVAADRRWADHPSFETTFLVAAALTMAVGLYRALTEQQTALAVVLVIAGLIAMPLWARRELRDDPIRSVVRKTCFVAAVTVVTVVVLFVARPEPEPPVFGLGVDGIAVATDDAPPEIADWIGASLGRVGPFDGCEIEPTPVEVWDPATTALARFDDPNHPTRADLLIDVRIAGPTSSGTFEVSLGMEPVSVSARTAGDPYVLDEMRARSASVDVDRHLGSSATTRFPELDVLPAIIAGLREFDDSTPTAIERARCAFGEARSRLEAAGTGSRGFSASLDMLIAATYIRQASVPAARAEALESAAASLDRASELVGSGDVPGVEPDRAALAVIEANRRGVQYLELFGVDGTIDDAIDASTIAALVEDFDATNVGEHSPSGQVLVRTLTAKLLVAAAVETETRPGFSATGDRERFFEVAESAVTKAIELGTSADDIAVASHLADAYATRGQIRAEGRRPGVAARDYAEAADLVGGSLEQSYRLFQAVSLKLDCDPAATEILDDVAAYLDDVSDAAVRAKFEVANAVEVTECPQDAS